MPSETTEAAERASDYTAELEEVCCLVVKAAAKQTIVSQSIRAAAGRQGADLGIGQDGINKTAVGRMHNAARKARAVLAPEVVSQLEEAAEREVKAKGEGET